MDIVETEQMKHILRTRRKLTQHLNAGENVLLQANVLHMHTPLIILIVVSITADLIHMETTGVASGKHVAKMLHAT